jgi:hypothetical protein
LQTRGAFISSETTLRVRIPYPLTPSHPLLPLSGFVDPAYQQTCPLDASSDGYALGASPTNTAPLDL